MEQKMIFDEKLKKEVIARCEKKLYDDWNRYGVTVSLPVYVINSMLQELENCKNKLDKLSYDHGKTDAINLILEMINNQAMHVTTIPETKLGDGITKNLALIEMINIIKKHLNVT
jgi:hypothetical protein